MQSHCIILDIFCPMHPGHFSESPTYYICPNIHVSHHERKKIPFLIILPICVHGSRAHPSSHQMTPEIQIYLMPVPQPLNSILLTYQSQLFSQMLYRTLKILPLQILNSSSFYFSAPSHSSATVAARLIALICVALNIVADKLAAVVPPAS